MCNHLDQLDDNTEKFIWDPDGVYSAASPEEAMQLRAEDKKIYIAAALEHPLLQVQAMATNALTQLIKFGVEGYGIPSRADYTQDDMTLQLPPQAPWQTAVSTVHYIVVFVSLAFLVSVWRRASRPERQFIVLIVATILLEAMAGAFSEPVPRYEARVMWLIPMTAMLLWLRHGRNSRFDA